MPATFVPHGNQNLPADTSKKKPEQTPSSQFFPDDWEPRPVPTYTGTDPQFVVDL